MDSSAGFVATKNGVGDTLRAVVDSGAVASSDTREGLTTQ
jgi:hypothetical protein